MGAIFNRINNESEHVNYLLANCDVPMRQNIVLILSLSCFFIAHRSFKLTLIYFYFLARDCNNFVYSFFFYQRYPECHIIKLSYYINTNEIPGELLRANMISSHVKITCYLHM